MRFAPRFTITNRITADLTTIERARGFLEAATLSEEWVRRMSQRALLLEAHHTTHIEGTQLSVEQAEQVWAGHEVKGAIRADVLAAEKGLNERQTILINALLERGSLTLAEAWFLLPETARRTIQRDLKRLAELGLVSEVGRGPTDPNRAYRWSPPKQ